MYLVDMLLASSAAPLRFPAHKFNNRLWIDGGVVANNPSMYAHMSASQYVDNPKKDILHISLGTGKHMGDYLVSQMVDSPLYWSSNLLNILTEASSGMVS